MASMIQVFICDEGTSNLRWAIDVERSATIMDLKKKIEETYNIAVSNQTLKFHDDTLHHDDLITQKCMVINDLYQVHLFVATPPPNMIDQDLPVTMRVYVMAYSSEWEILIPVDVNAGDNVGELRELVQIKELSLPQDYYFLHEPSGRILDDHRSFQSQGVSHGHEIEIFPGFA